MSSFEQEQFGAHFHLRPVFRQPIQSAPPIQATNFAQRTSNVLRPGTLADMTGQVRTRAFLRRVIDAAKAKAQPLDHTLIVAPSGAGKSTLANIIANELDVDCYQVEAPISHDTLMQLRDAMMDGDILFIDEIHQQAITERRGRSASTQPEVLFSVMEDRKLIAGGQVLDFPRITVIGATTDEGMLPDPFINRFPLRPVLEPYAECDLAQIADANARSLGLQLHLSAAMLFASAARGVPRQINNYMRNAQALAPDDVIDDALAREVVNDLNRTTDDGLTLDMQNVLTFLHDRCGRVTGNGLVSYKASVSTIATAIGKSRDTKAILLRIEPYLIQKGYLQVGHGGRSLTPAGVQRAIALSTPKGTP